MVLTPQQPQTLIQDRWQEGLGGGFVVIPTVLLLNQRTLGLDCEEMVVLANLLAHWWEDDRAPYPRTDTLSQRTGMLKRTVQRRIRQLEKKGFLTREAAVRGSGRVTLYDLHKTVEKLKPLGQTAREIRELHQRRPAQAGAAEVTLQE